jgi:hypothetical protein
MGRQLAFLSLSLDDDRELLAGEGGDRESESKSQ